MRPQAAEQGHYAMLLRQVLEAPELADAAFGELLRNSSGMSNGCSNFLAVPGPSADNERPSVGSEANAIRGDENPPFLAYCRSNRAAGDFTHCHRVVARHHVRGAVRHTLAFIPLLPARS